MLTIIHNLGLGDHIVCNGLVRYYAKTQKIGLFCKNKNYINVSQMYNDDNVVIQPVCNNTYSSDIKPKTPYLRIGNLQNEEGWDKQFYAQADLDFQLSWDLFKCCRNIEKENEIFRLLNPENRSYIFVHDTSIGQNVPKIKLKGFIIKPEKYNFFDYLKIIEYADEIHCVNSSFIHLTDRVKTNGKLYYHTYNLPIDSMTLKKNWERC